MWPADLASSYDVPFGERASPAIISLAQRNARPLSRNGTNPPSPLTLSPAIATEPLNPSGAHRGGLRGSDEDVEATDKDIAMDSEDSNCASTGATPLLPPATRKLCVRHQRMADEGTTARLQKVCCRFFPFFYPVPLSFLSVVLPFAACSSEESSHGKADADLAASHYPYVSRGYSMLPSDRQRVFPLTIVDL